jgi:hypothetical protein
VIPRWVGVVLIAMMPLHVALRPEHGWNLFAACDVVAVVTALAVIARWPRVAAIAGLFAVAVGVPAIVVGSFTTYPINPTGVVLHVVPPIIGVLAIARHGLPPRAALIAWVAYVMLVVGGPLVTPRRLNINMVNRPWRPVAHLFGVRGTFQVCLLVLVGAMLWLGQTVIVVVHRRRFPFAVGDGMPPRR